MLALYFNKYVNWLDTQLESHSKSPYYAWKLALFCALVTVFFACPDYYKQWIDPWSWTLDQHKSLEDKILHPFTQVEQNPNNHASKLIYRLSVPLIGHALHLSLHQLLLIQHLLGIVIFYLMYNMVFKRTQNVFVSTCTVLALAFTYIGNAAYHDLVGFFEGFLFTFLLLAFTVKNPVLKFIFVFLTLFTDERGIFALGFFMMAEFIFDFDKLAFPRREIRYFFPYLLPCIIYLPIRKFIGRFFDLHLILGDQVGFKAIWYNLGTSTIALFSAMEGFLLVIGIFLFVLSRKMPAALWLVVAYMILFFGATTMVHDTTRSYSYCFGLVLMAAIFLEKNMSKIEVRNLFAGVLLFNLVAQNQLVVGHLAFWIPPLPIRLIIWTLGEQNF